MVDFLLSCPVIALRVLLSVYNFAHFGTFGGPKSAENALRRISRVYIWPKNSFQVTLKKSIFDDFWQGVSLNFAPYILYQCSWRLFSSILMCLELYAGKKLLKTGLGEVHVSIWDTKTHFKLLWKNRFFTILGNFLVSSPIIIMQLWQFLDRFGSFFTVFLSYFRHWYVLNIRIQQFDQIAWNKK